MSGKQPEYPRTEWVVPVAEALGQAMRLLHLHELEMQKKYGRKDADLDAVMIRQFLPGVFSTAVFHIGTVPGDRTGEIERLVIEEGLSVDAALRKVGC
jgi:hypothetical protein